MTRDRFSAAMVRLGYPTAMVSFDGPGIGECYVIEHTGGGWSVYYSERGQRLRNRASTRRLTPFTTCSGGSLRTIRDARKVPISGAVWCLLVSLLVLC